MFHVKQWQDKKKRRDVSRETSLPLHRSSAGRGPGDADGEQNFFLAVLPLTLGVNSRGAHQRQPPLDGI